METPSFCKKKSFRAKEERKGRITFTHFLRRARINRKKSYSVLFYSHSTFFRTSWLIQTPMLVISSELFWFCVFWKQTFRKSYHTYWRSQVLNNTPEQVMASPCLKRKFERCSKYFREKKSIKISILLLFSDKNLEKNMLDKIRLIDPLYVILSRNLRSMIRW